MERLVLEETKRVLAHERLEGHYLLLLVAYDAEARAHDEAADEIGEGEEGEALRRLGPRHVIDGQLVGINQQ